jgi:hypothetical protein
MVVNSGLYVLRYASASAQTDCPALSIKPSPTDGKGISLLPAPGHVGCDLVSPGDCILVRAERPGALEVTVTASRAGGSLEAEVKLERIALPKGDAEELQSQRGFRRGEPDVQILGHVARQGDVVSAQGEWMCGPDEPASIEGFELRWPNKPDGVELHYTVTIGSERRQRLEEKVSGQFAGTRGKSLPLVGLTMALSGRRAGDYELQADALFRGSPVIAKNGAELAFSGPTGREPLVGLRLFVVATRNDPENVRPLDRTGAVVMRQVGRVRVYRPGPKLSPKNREGVNGGIRI